MPWGAWGGGKDNQRAWFCTRGGGDEAKRASVPWGGRNPEAQPAGLGLQTCCFGDHPDTWGDRNDQNGKLDSCIDPSVLFVLVTEQREGGKEKLPTK